MRVLRAQAAGQRLQQLSAVPVACKPAARLVRKAFIVASQQRVVCHRDVSASAQVGTRPPVFHPPGLQFRPTPPTCLATVMDFNRVWISFVAWNLLNVVGLLLNLNISYLLFFAQRRMARESVFYNSLLSYITKPACPCCCVLATPTCARLGCSVQSSRSFQRSGLPPGQSLKQPGHVLLFLAVDGLPCL